MVRFLFVFINLIRVADLVYHYCLATNLIAVLPFNVSDTAGVACNWYDRQAASQNLKLVGKKEREFIFDFDCVSAIDYANGGFHVKNVDTHHSQVKSVTISSENHSNSLYSGILFRNAIRIIINSCDVIPKNF